MLRYHTHLKLLKSCNGQWSWKQNRGRIVTWKNKNSAGNCTRGRNERESSEDINQTCVLVCVCHPGLSGFIPERNTCTSLWHMLCVSWVLSEYLSMMLFLSVHHPSDKFHFPASLSHPRKSLCLQFGIIKWLIQITLPIKTQFNARKGHKRMNFWGKTTLKVPTLLPGLLMMRIWLNINWTFAFSSRETNIISKIHFLKYIYNLS